MRRNIGIILSYANTIINMLCGVLLSSVLLRQFGDTEYGLYQTVSSFVGYLVLLEFGTGTVMSRNIAVVRGKSECNNKILNRHFSTIILVSLFLSILIVLVGSIFYFSVDSIYSGTMTYDQRQYSKQMLIVLIIYLVITYISQGFDGFLLGYENYSFAKVIGIIRTVIRTLLLVFFSYAFKFSIIICFVDLFLSVIILVVYLIYCKKKYSMSVSLKYFDKAVFISSIPMCLALLLQTIINQANSGVDKFIIGVSIDVESVALYSIAQYIFTMFTSMIAIPVTMYRPEVAKNVSSGLKGEQLTDALISPCRLSALIGGSILFGFIAVGRQFISVLYGEDKTIAWVYALIVMIPTHIYMTVAVIQNVLEALNRFKFRSAVLIGTTLLNVILTVIMIKQYGIIGAVIATAISSIVGHIIIMNIFYNNKIEINVFRLYKESYKGIIFVQILSSIISYFVSEFIYNTLLSLIIGGLLFCLLNFGLSFIFGLNDNEKKKLRSMFNVLNRKKKLED